MKSLFNIFFLLFTIGNISAQQIDSLTASEILDKSIKFCGGEKNIKKIENTELSYVYLTDNDNKVSISDKVVCGKKYSQSILSYDYQSQSTFFDGNVLSRVDGDNIKHVSEITKVEEIKLKTYNQVQFGYVEEGYELTRMEDERFNHFDCYVVKATAKSGYSTVNFFDKTNFRLLMIVYPNGGKSCMIKYKFVDDVLFNSTILNITPEKEQQRLILLSAKNNISISDLWFVCPYDSTLQVPLEVKTGSFNPINSTSSLERTDFTQTEIFDQGNSKFVMYLTWRNEDTYFMIDEKSLKANSDNSGLEVLVRIISWDKNGYICHFLSGDSFGNQEYKRKE